MIFSSIVSKGKKIFDQKNNSINNNQNLNYRFGADFFLNKKSTLGFLLNGNLSENENNSSAVTPIYTKGSTELDSSLVASNDEYGTNKNTSLNLNYVYQGEGKSLNIDLDYASYDNTGNSYQPNTYYSTEENVLQQNIFSNITPTKINIYTAKADWESNLAGGKLGTGIKTSFVNTDNTFENYDIVEGVRTLNTDLSNNFVYTENVIAGYLSWQRKLGEKWNLMLGLRGEQTHSEGDLTSYKETEDENVTRNYLNFFPSGGMTYNMSEKHSFRINYSKRIDRPNYQNLNPFEFKLDELTYRKGNPFLKPQYSNSYSLSHTFNSTLSTSLSFTETTDFSSQITESVNENASRLIQANLATQKNLSLTVSYPFSITKWWSVYATLTGFRLQTQANLEGGMIDLETMSLNGYGQNTFTLPKGFKFELSGWYNSPALWGNWTTTTQYDVSAGLSKQFWNEKANLKLSVSDIFRTNPWGGESTFGDLYIRGGGSWESRQVRLNFNYIFGSKSVAGSRRRNTGIDDEKSRAQ